MQHNTELCARAIGLRQARRDDLRIAAGYRVFGSSLYHEEEGEPSLSPAFASSGQSGAEFTFVPEFNHHSASGCEPRWPYGVKARQSPRQKCNRRVFSASTSSMNEKGSTSSRGAGRPCIPREMTTVHRNYAPNCTPNCKHILPGAKDERIESWRNS